MKLMVGMLMKKQNQNKKSTLRIAYFREEILKMKDRIKFFSKKIVNNLAGH